MSQKPCTYARGSICAVYGCNNYKFQKDSKSFFRMPRDLERLKKWIVACKRSDLDSLLKVKDADYFNKNYVVCSDHFDIECFRNKDFHSQGLLPNSVPTLNLYNVREPLKRKSRCENSIVECATSSKKMELETEKENEAPVVATVSSLQEENTKLHQIIQNYKKSLNNKCSLLSKYKKKCLLLKQKLLQSKSTNTVAQSSKMTKVCQQFIKSQEKLSNKHKLGRRYETSDKELALALYYCSTKSYTLLQKYFCLPSLSSLRSWLNNLHVGCGLNSTVLGLLKLKAEKLNSKEKVVSLVFDEMSLKEVLNYDARRDIFEGFQDFGDHSLENLKLCNQAMVFMIKGIYVDFKQVVGYFLSKDAMPGVALNFTHI